MPLGYEVFSPKAFQFWSNPSVRPKRTFEAILIFPDQIFGGEGLQTIEPYLVKSFSRPGYDTIDTKIGEYQLRSGDYAKIDYPTQGFTTKALRVELADVAGFGASGAETAAAIHTSLAMTQKTMTFEHEAAASAEGKPTKKYKQMIGTFAAYPRMFFILELDGKGGQLGAWEIWNPVLTSIDFSDIDYETDSLATIDLSFSYKNFKYDQSWGERLLKNKLKRIEDDPMTLTTGWMTAASDWFAQKLSFGPQSQPFVGSSMSIKQEKTP